MQSVTRKLRYTCIFGGLVGLLFSVGCGGDKSYRLSGTVTFKGKSVPDGHIIFEPDSSKGNRGPSGMSKIVDGKYDTRADGGMGVVGGPHVITIVGLDGKVRDGNSGEIGLPGILFPTYTVPKELPKQNSTLDFEVGSK